MGKRTFSYDNFVGFENKEVKFLEDQLETLRELTKMTQDEIDRIQSNCEHEYMFQCQGMYEDSYKCRLCGHETEH